jgi:DNA invertase Pin-like site-specific DNA recombinase
MRRMVDAFGEYERLIIKARTRAALQAKRRRGERTGQVPIGRRLAENGVDLVDDPDEAEVLILIRDLRAGGMSLRAVAEELTRSGAPTKGGAAWKHPTVQRVLGRPT